METPLPEAAGLARYATGKSDERSPRSIGNPGPTGRNVPFGICVALHGLGRRVGDALRDSLAHAHRGRVATIREPAELTPFVEALAYRIGQFSPQAVAWIKDCIDAAEPSLADGLAKEAGYFLEASRDPGVRDTLSGFLKAGGETPVVERDLGGYPW